MKADPQAQRRLLDLQNVDVSLAQLHHRAKTLPEHAQAADIAAQRAAMEEQFVAAETRVSDLQQRQVRAEADLQPVRDRLRRDQEQVDSGAVGDPKALTSMLEEIKSLTKRISDLEDDELAVMEELEQAMSARNGLAAKRIELTAKSVEISERKSEKMAAFKFELQGLTQQRGALVTELPAALVELYEKIAARSGGLGAAALQGGRCLGCRLEANPSDLVRYREAHEDEVVRCEECGRILVRSM